MGMNIYCNNLNFNQQPFDEWFDYTKLSKDIHSILPVNLLNLNYVEFLKSVGIFVSWIDVFYKKASELKANGIHTDDFGRDCPDENKGGDYVKINYIYGGKDSIMQWWKPNISSVNKMPLISSGGRPYLPYTEDEVDLVYESPLRGPSLVQVGVPHSIYNPIEERWAVCFVLRNTTTQKRMTMFDAYHNLKDFIV